MALALAAVAVEVLIVAAAVWTVPLPSRLLTPPSMVVEYADGSVAHVFLAADDRYRMAAELDRVDPAYVEALLRFEDKRFRRHAGVDPIAVARATVLNLQQRRVVSGASTLTMQLVRLLEPRPRTLGSKAVEALRAVQLELRLSKQEILAAYLTFTPYGGNLEGIEAASWAYFGHGPRELSADEIAVLLAVPQNPARRAPTAATRGELRQARNRIALLLANHAVAPFTDPALSEILASVRVPAEVRPMPREAAHAATWLRARMPETTRVATTLDRGLQRMAETRLREAHRGARLLGVHNGSAVVVDHQTGAILALVGNPDFWDDEHGGQIAGFDVARSPGSALKPFLFALAVDRGLILPGTLVEDVPSRWGGYAPSNANDRFSGLVRLDEALSASLNIPFVGLLQELQVPVFLGALRACEVTSLHRDDDRYGLSAAIGGVEITPLELAGLYAMLARDGRTSALRVVAGEEPGRGGRILSPGASYLTRRVLRRRDRPDYPSRRRYQRVPRSIHWKTGTSFGHLDAWAAGSDSEHTAVVWFGNFDRTPASDLVGADLAGPVLFDLLEGAADRSRTPMAEVPPHDLMRVRVCAHSGMLPSAACPSTVETLALRQRIPVRRCSFHVAVDVDLDSGLALDPSCRQGRRWESRSFLVYPAAVRRFLGDRAWLERPVPSPAPECRPASGSRPPRIVSPAHGQVVMLPPGLDPALQEVPLVADSAVIGGTVSWFVNGEFLGRAAPCEAMWWVPKPGSHELLVMDASGLSARRTITVQGPAT
jgi:penicillin-binding protein 1C